LEFLSKRLENGLEVLAECNPAAHSAAVGFFVKTGARDESDAVAGVSHFLEHMMFKGTPTRAADDVNREFDEMGAHYNAFTSEENTVYYAAVLPELVDRAVGLLADILRPSLREEDFDTEKQVIIEEIRMYDDQPPFGADEKIRAAFFGDHPLSRSVLGTEQSIEALSVEAMRDYFRRRYSPGNVGVVAAGCVDFDRLVAQVEACCGTWEPVENGRQVGKAAWNRGFVLHRRPSATQQYLLQMAGGPAADDQRRYAAKVLSTMLGDDSGSRLYWDLLDPGRAEQAGLGHHEYMGSGIFAAYVSCDPDDAATNLEIVQQAYRKVESDGFAAEEVAQAKSKVRSRIVLASERPRGRLFAVGSDWLYERDYSAVADDLAILEGIGLDDVHAVLEQFPLSQNLTLAIGPLETLDPPEELRHSA
jgi:predicted Zn-dependent peptidase